MAYLSSSKKRNFAHGIASVESLIFDYYLDSQDLLSNKSQPGFGDSDQNCDLCVELENKVNSVCNCKSQLNSQNSLQETTKNIQKKYTSSRNLKDDEQRNMTTPNLIQSSVNSFFLHSSKYLKVLLDSIDSKGENQYPTQVEKKSVSLENTSCFNFSPRAKLNPSQLEHKGLSIPGQLNNTIVSKTHTGECETARSTQVNKPVLLMGAASQDNVKGDSYYTEQKRKPLSNLSVKIEPTELLLDVLTHKD